MAYDPSRWYSYSKERKEQDNTGETSRSTSLPAHLAQAVNKFTYQVNLDDKLLATVRNEIFKKEELKRQHLQEQLTNSNPDSNASYDLVSLSSNEPGQSSVDTSVTASINEKDYRRFIDLVTQLQTMVQELPGQYIKLLHYDMLCQIAQSLADGTVFQIVKGLEDIQQLKERNLLNRRMKLLGEHKALRVELTKKHQDALQSCQSRPHQLPLLEKQHLEEKRALESRLDEELAQLDQKLILELDQQASDQQATLQRAGVPLFSVTNNEEEVRLQMYILDFITRLTPD